jgi:rubrerythrin
MEDITLKEIIDYAKINEDNARKFYLKASGHAKGDNVKGLLKSMADDEVKHIERLDEIDKMIDEGKPLPAPHGITKPLGYAEFVGDIKLGDDADYQEVLKFAMAKEKEAMESYARYAKLTDVADAKKLFELLAEEEREHLSELEAKFDDFMKEIENW